jgi:hypothetical protein
MPGGGRGIADLAESIPVMHHPRCGILGGHLKTGHTWSLQNRPTERTQNKSIYNLPMGVPANFFCDPA